MKEEFVKLYAPYLTKIKNKKIIFFVEVDIPLGEHKKLKIDAVSNCKKYNDITLSPESIKIDLFKFKGNDFIKKLKISSYHGTIFEISSLNNYFILKSKTMNHSLSPLFDEKANNFNIEKIKIEDTKDLKQFKSIYLIKEIEDFKKKIEENFIVIDELIFMKVDGFFNLIHNDGYSSINDRFYVNLNLIDISNNINFQNIDNASVRFNFFSDENPFMIFKESRFYIDKIAEMKEKLKKIKTIYDEGDFFLKNSISLFLRSNNYDNLIDKINIHKESIFFNQDTTGNKTRYYNFLENQINRADNVLDRTLSFVELKGDGQKLETKFSMD